MTKAALWLRVSDPDVQDASNQLGPLMAEASRRRLQVVRTYTVGASGYKGEHLKALSRVYADARRSVFEVLLFWSLDRLSRQGVGPTLEIANRLTGYGVELVSLREPWLESGGIARDLLLSVLAWVAEYESARRSERTRAGLERARANGAQLGRPKGSKDRRRRKQSGYYRRWAIQRETDWPNGQ